MKTLVVIFTILAVAAAVPRAYLSKASSNLPGITSLEALAGVNMKSSGGQEEVDKQSRWPPHLGGISTIGCYQSFVQINPGLKYVDTMLGINNLQLEVSCEQHRARGMQRDCTRVTLRAEGRHESHDTFVDLCDESTGIFGKNKIYFFACAAATTPPPLCARFNLIKHLVLT